MTATQNALAKRYAKALLTQSLESGLDAAALNADLQALANWFTSTPDAQTYFEHPAVAQTAKINLVQQSLSQALHGTITRLFTLLIQNGRARLLPAVAEAYRQLLNAHMGVIEGQLISATKLDAATQQAIAETLKTKLDARQVTLQNQVDPEVLGGVKLIFGDQVIDGTLSSQLKQLEAQLIAAG
ncbi:MAG: ATP synthase F1 subunit delta [Vampirovibrionales bacterium]|nr:ATP synthase F1 subunit delta [Vampirovibrionales bacterium]